MIEVRGQSVRRGERGAVLVHVAFALVGLLAFSALAIDYGVLWASRRQAQNSADAAAMAGATSLALAPTDFDTARSAAAAVGTTNPVWGQAPVIEPATDVQFPVCLPVQDVPSRCVRVNVYRNQERANALPTYFAQLVGVTSQGVRAMAMARVAQANTVRCARPWAIPDKWRDVVDATPPVDVDTSTPDDLFERRALKGKGPLLDPRDAYIPQNGPDPDGLGREYSGYRPAIDTGVQVTLHQGDPTDYVSGQWFFPVSLPGGGGTENYYRDITQCNSAAVGIGDTIQTEGIDLSVQTADGVNDLIAQDSGAYWDVGCTCVRGSSAHSLSPRVVPIMVFSAEDYDLADRTSGSFSFPIVKMLGLFVESMQGSSIVGRIMSIPAEYHGGGAGVGPREPTSFLYTVMLIR